MSNKPTPETLRTFCEVLSRNFDEIAKPLAESFRVPVSGIVACEMFGAFVGDVPRDSDRAVRVMARMQIAIKGTMEQLASFHYHTAEEFQARVDAEIAKIEADHANNSRFGRVTRAAGTEGVS